MFNDSNIFMIVIFFFFLTADEQTDSAVIYTTSVILPFPLLPCRQKALFGFIITFIIPWSAVIRVKIFDFYVIL